MLALTGPRQSGKTTLARATFPDKPYVLLENPDERDFAETDPRRFLARFPEGAREWLSVLEASYLVFRLPPHHRNFGKRLVKTSKLYFLDVGRMAWLLGIRDAQTLETHAARGALFETWGIGELVKQRFNAG